MPELITAPPARLELAPAEPRAAETARARSPARLPPWPPRTPARRQGALSRLCRFLSNVVFLVPALVGLALFALVLVPAAFVAGVFLLVGLAPVLVVALGIFLTTDADLAAQQAADEGASTRSA